MMLDKMRDMGNVRGVLRDKTGAALFAALFLRFGGILGR